MSGYYSFCFCWSCCPVGQGQATTSVAWWIDDSRGGVGSKGLAERSCPVGANADEPHLAAGWVGVVWLRERGRA